MTDSTRRLERRLNIIASLLTVVVLLLVGMMRRVKIATDVSFDFLPPIHATLNAITAVVLLYAYYQIRQGNVARHRRAIYVALSFSLLFLISYVLYHFTTPETRYDGEGFWRMVYFFLLITHIIAAAVIFPFVLFTFIRAYTGQFERHRRLARWVFPVWLYVAVSGPICYLMLMPFYKN